MDASSSHYCLLDGRNNYSETSERGCNFDATEILQKNCEGQSSQRSIKCLSSVCHPGSHTTLTVIRERYLRDDVPCGIEGCPACDGVEGLQLPRQGDAGHKLFPTGHFVLPDTNVFLHQVCLFDIVYMRRMTLMSDIRWTSWNLACSVRQSFSYRQFWRKFDIARCRYTVV